MEITIATWNINSLRLRQNLLHKLMDGLTPDVICLQETKVPDELFPEAIAGAIGFGHVLKRGMKGYNGVAILSRLPLKLVDDTPDWCSRNDCRHVAARVETGGAPVVIHNFYVPAGGDFQTRSKILNSRISWILLPRRARILQLTRRHAAFWWGI